MNDFKSLSLSPDLLRALEEAGLKQMTPIQAQSIPIFLNDQDFIGQSKTGSGKTAAFIIPILEKVNINTLTVQALILGPTREICDQVLRECLKFTTHLKKVRSVSLVGGRPYSPQIDALKLGVQIVVGTPGRTLELLRSKKLNVSNLKILVLDEADRLLEEGFADEMNAIISELPKCRQTALFSATFPAEIGNLSRRHQRNARIISIEDLDANSSRITQYLYSAEKPEKIQRLLQVLRDHPSPCTLVFCRTKATVEEIGNYLTQLKAACRTLHADLPQAQRDLSITLFRNGSLRLLVATDVAARGLDIEALDLVINFDLPASPEVYVHRIGRTGRAGRHGVAVSIATEYEADLVLEIQNFTRVAMIKAGHLQPAAFDDLLDLQQPLMKTILISAGTTSGLSENELRRILLAGEPELAPIDIGKIELHASVTYVAIVASTAQRVLLKLKVTQLRSRFGSCHLIV